MVYAQCVYTKEIEKGGEKKNVRVFVVKWEGGGEGQTAGPRFFG